jgi:hypothetical protein
MCSVLRFCWSDFLLFRCAEVSDVLCFVVAIEFCYNKEKKSEKQPKLHVDRQKEYVKTPHLHSAIGLKPSALNCLLLAGDGPKQRSKGEEQVDREKAVAYSVLYSSPSSPTSKYYL